MQTQVDDAGRREDSPRKAAPSDSPLAVVYAAIICCAVMAMIVAAVAAAS
jgi:hypothetical protein